MINDGSGTINAGRIVGRINDGKGKIDRGRTINVGGSVVEMERLTAEGESVTRVSDIVIVGESVDGAGHVTVNIHKASLLISSSISLIKAWPLCSSSGSQSQILPSTPPHLSKLKS